MSGMVMSELVNKPNVSKSVAGLYIGIVVFIAALIAFFAYAGFFTPMGVLGTMSAIVLMVVEAIMLFILASLYGTRYILTDEKLVIKASKFIGGGKEISLKAVKSAERTLIPFGFRLFGASFYGGHYHIPGLGRAFVTMTNFDDGVLITSDRGNYIITPSDPENFIETIKERIKR